VSVAQVLSRAQLGLEAPLVQIEAHLGSGLPGFSIVGLPAPVVRESRERVRSAILNAGYDFPPGRITVNLAPVELSKEGGRYDLPVALALLVASGQLAPAPRAPTECYGELGLGGELRPVKGLLLAAIRAAQAGHDLLVPTADLAEVRLARHPRAFGFGALTQACAFLSGAPYSTPELPEPDPQIVSIEEQNISIDQVKGQWRAKRALAIAAAGGHSLLMVGPPGSGKSMLAARLPALLPPLTEAEALEVAGIASISPHGFDPASWGRRPFRSPHHAASANAIVGGGSQLRAGEISLAHRGVLFMDELPEFDRRVLEALREPLESGAITLARAAGRLELPAEFQLVAAMNPCPCGYLGDAVQGCRCGPRRVQRYRDRISGPLLDRIDLHIEVPRVELPALQQGPAAQARPAAGASQAPGPGISGELLAAGVREARARQLRRQGCCNARLDHAGIEAHCRADSPARRVLELVGERLGLSARGYHRVLKVARTIADLEGAALIGAVHVGEAASLRLAPTVMNATAGPPDAIGSSTPCSQRRP
jgi:magnesium chelatase family protein